MNRRRALLAGLAALALCWGGYVGFVFAQESLTAQQETLVMTSGSATPGGTVSAHVVARNHRTGEALSDSDVTVELVDGENETVVERGATDETGGYTATFEVPNRTGDYDVRVRTDSRIGTDTATTGLNVSRDYAITVDTDKPVYQPGQDVQVRAIVRERAGGPVTDEATVTVTGPKGNRLFSRAVDLNEFGMGNATVPIADVGRTGEYRVTVGHGGDERTKTVSVKEYKTPRFDVGFRPDADYYRPGETMRATITSEYFFGEPVANATVTVEGEGYVGDFQRFATVETTTDGDGVATVDVQLPEYFVGLPEQSGKGVAVLNVSVTDEAGHTETITRQVPIAQDDLLVNAFAADDRLVPGVENTVYVTTEYPDGTPAQATVEVNGDTVETNRYGVGTYEFVPEDRYDQRLELHAEAGDATGSEQVSFRTERGDRIVLRLDGATHEVGDTVSGRALVPNATGSVYVDVVSGKQTVLTKRVPVNGTRATFSFSVPQAARGETTVRAWAIFRNNRVGSSARTILVEPASAVAVDVTSGQDSYRPGDDATFTVETRRDGEPVPAAVGIDVVDESVFAVEEDRAGLAQTHYELEQELQRPELFVHDYERDAPEPSATPGKSATDERATSEDGAELAREASVAQLSTNADAVTRNTYEEKRERIERQQRETAAINGKLLALLLIAVPLGFTAVEGRRTGAREFATRFGKAAVGLVLALVASAALLALLVALLELPGILVGVATGLVVLIVGVGYLLVDGATSTAGTDRRFAAAMGTVVALGLAGLALALTDVVAFGALDPPAWLAVLGALVLLPLTYAASTGVDTRRGQTAVVIVGVVLLLVAVPIGSTFVLGLGAQAGADAGTVDRGADLQAEDAGSGGDGSADGDQAGATQVRQWFPETAASRTVVTGDDGRATMKVGMADTITTWRVSSLASTRAGAVGSDRSSVRVFQPFFVKPDVPLALTRNDTVTVPVSVYNYENTSTTVTVDLKRADWFEADGYERSVELGPNEVDSVAFEVTAERVGEHPLTMVAVSERANGTRTTDAVRKSVTVEPDGRERSVAHSGTLDGSATASVRVPERAVDNSSKTVLRTYPGAFGQVVGGMDALLSKPTGCFEQTSSSLYPNVLALQYMERTGEDNPEVRMRAERFIATGYQRILTFETDTPGGYSLFGENPPRVLLTSYGLMEMADMNRVYEVDQRTITDMQSYLRSEQRADGSWQSDRGLEYPLGVSGDEVTTTAYVTWSLAHSGADGEAVDDGARYVERNLDVETASTSQLAIALNALVAADHAPDLRQRIVDELDERAVVEDGAVHWERSDADEDRGYRYGDKSTLTTAMVANGLVEGGYAPGLADGALTWLVEQKSGDGGWGSTQNTVMALKALVNAQTGQGEIQPGEIEVLRNGETVATRTITEQNSDEVQTFVLPAEPGANDYELRGPEGDLYYELETTYHEPWPEERRGEADGEAPVSMSVSYNRTNLTVDDTVAVTANVTSREGTIGTALVSLGVPPGFTVDEESLHRLEEAGLVSRYEFRGRQVILYVEDLRGSVSLPYEMRATTPVEATTGSASVYDYYNPETEAVDAPVTVHVNTSGE